MENVDDELTAREETVGDELASAQGDGGGVVGLCKIWSANRDPEYALSCH